MGLPALFGPGGVDAGLRFAEAMQEQRVIRHGFFDQLREEKKLGSADNGVNTLLERLNRGEGLKGVSKQNYRSVPALGHGHRLQGLKRKILSDVIRREEFLDDHNLVTNLAEANQKIAVSRGGMHFVAEAGKGGASRLEPFRSGERQKRGLVGGTDEIKAVGHFNES